jgi:hypothetical protein
MNKSKDVLYSGMLGILWLANMVSASCWRNNSGVRGWPDCNTTQDLYLVILDT